MKTIAAVLHQMERPRPYAQSQPMVIEELELPPPAPDEVLVEVKGAGLCHSDLSVINGSRPRPMPMVLGHEASGIVREVGAQVRGFKPDDHVIFTFIPGCGACRFCQVGRPSLCEPGMLANTAGTLMNGARRFTGKKAKDYFHHCGVSGYSQYTLTMPGSLVKIDRDLPFEQATLFGCAVTTGAGAVMNTARVQPGQSVAVFGLGGVGLSAVLGAKACGAWPLIAVDLLEHKLTLAKELGATHTINASTTDPVAAIRDLTHGGVEIAIESAGSAVVLAQAYNATQRGGTTVAIGLPHPQAQFSIPAVTLSAEEKTVRGSYQGSCVPSRDIPRFIELFRAGLLPVDRLLSRVIKLEQINEGFDALDRGDVARQVILF
ncbi:MAG: alcohol dehydrogenase [Pedosphaera sp.]|nr:alcohol dehydrogenase [Pedosphaera sp.]MSU44143.1 alcohol dehydrogenase [Pedosphaera sp.]